MIGGIDPASTEKPLSFIPLSLQANCIGTNARTAEMCKLTENSSRDSQIAFCQQTLHDLRQSRNQCMGTDRTGQQASACEYPSTGLRSRRSLHCGRPLVHRIRLSGTGAALHHVPVKRTITKRIGVGEQSIDTRQSLWNRTSANRSLPWDWLSNRISMTYGNLPPNISLPASSPNRERS